MFSSTTLEWIDSRIKAREQLLKKKVWDALDPSVPTVDAGAFSQPIADLAVALTNLVEREGTKKIPATTATADISMILRQVTATYNAIRWINADTTRYGNVGYKGSYTFVTLPLVRTIIDGFYNATSLLEDPSRAKSYRISGIYWMRRALELDEAKYKNDPAWQPHLTERRSMVSDLMRLENISTTDLDDKTNSWPLLSEYLRQKPKSARHRKLMQQVTQYFWAEYSAVSHVSFDALVSLYGFLARDRLRHEERDKIDDASLRHLTMHYARAAGILLCLLTELQHYFNFSGHNIDKRLRELWIAMNPLYEIRELYNLRYNSILREPEPKT